VSLPELKRNSVGKQIFYFRQKKINVCNGGVDDEDYDTTKLVIAHPEIAKAKRFVDTIIETG
jgi:hypothetical protein